MMEPRKLTFATSTIGGEYGGFGVGAFVVGGFVAALVNNGVVLTLLYGVVVVDSGRVVENVVPLI